MKNAGESGEKTVKFCVNRQKKKKGLHFLMVCDIIYKHLVYRCVVCPLGLGANGG